MNIQDSSNIILRARNLRVQFSDSTRGTTTEAVRGISFDLQRGKTLAIVGESGSGKSVTSYSILRLIQKPGKITGGSILLRDSSGDGEIDLANLPDNSPQLFATRGGRISMIFQEPMTALSPVHTIGNQICEALLLHRTRDKREANRLATEMLGRVGITDPSGA